MAERLSYVSLANDLTANEAAYVVDVPLKQVHRIIDTEILGDRALRHGPRSIARKDLVGLKLAHLTLETMSLDTRKRLVAAALRTPTVNAVSEGDVAIALAPIRDDIRARLSTLDRANDLVHSDPAILNGAPSFVGAAVSVHEVAERVMGGENSKAVAMDYPRLTPAQVELAVVYARVNPRRGRPPRKADKTLITDASVSAQDAGFQVLKAELQQDATGKKLEDLAAQLVGGLLRLEIAVARSGFQHGGDAGPAGRGGRKFRIECKRYADTNPLNDRELLGEIDQALNRDEALEAWVLVSTRTVPEQLRQDLTLKGERLGLPIVILSWDDNGTRSLAALCASAPEVVDQIISPRAGEASRALAPLMAAAIEEIRRDLQSWSLGFETLRRRSHRRLSEIWASKRVSVAELGQDVAGGARPKKIKRVSTQQALSGWWSGRAEAGAPMVIIGADGVGKTWTALDWLVDNTDDQPIVLVVSSSSAAIALRAASPLSIRQFLAQRLYELTSGQRSLDHWLMRVARLLERPSADGPAFTIVLDGLNQEPSVSWLKVLQVLQSPEFEGRVRVILSTRRLHLTEKLSNFKALQVAPVETEVVPYNLVEGGELDQMLDFEGLSRSDLAPDLLELARTPRLFDLVVRLKDKVSGTEKVTVHRLLWEYGRDSFGVRAERSFTESEWHDWLRQIAERLRDGNSAFNSKELSEAAGQPYHQAEDVYRRLSDIVDGQFTQPGIGGGYELAPAMVAHALAAALLADLAKRSPAAFDDLEASLNQWLDPISGLDQRAEILRAAVSILIERGDDTRGPLAGVLVTAWLQTQNLVDQHRRELAAFAANLTAPLLDAVEHSRSNAQASARLWALIALRAIPRDDSAALADIIERALRWYRFISRDRPNTGWPGDEQIEKDRADYYLKRLGIDEAGPLEVLGWPMELVDADDGALFSMFPTIIEGFPLLTAAPLFELAAINVSVGRPSVGLDRLQWLLLLNEVDPHEVAGALRVRAAALEARTPEAGMYSQLGALVSARLLWLTGFEQDDLKAQEINPPLGRIWSYETDYLNDPTASFVALERRHADHVLCDMKRPLHVRLNRTRVFWTDPAFEPPASFVAELRAAAQRIDPAKLDCTMGNSAEDHAFEEIEPVLARCAPDLLADIVRSKLLAMRSSEPKQRYWRAIQVLPNFILADDEARISARSLRLQGVEPHKGDEILASNRLLLVELVGKTALEQLMAIMDAGLDLITTDFGSVLATPSLHDVETLLQRFGDGTAKQRHDLLCLFSLFKIPDNEPLWAWLRALAQGDDSLNRGVAYRALARSDPKRFGRELLQADWRWDSADNFWVNHYGSGALIEAAAAVPFDQIAPRLAPWRLLEAVRRRGADAGEVRLAATIFGDVLGGGSTPEPDPGSDLSVRLDRSKDFPAVYNMDLRKSADAARDPTAGFKPLGDPDAWRLAWERASQTAQQRIAEARAAGANLYLADVSAEDFTPVWSLAPDVFDLWLEGAETQSTDFVRRVRLAESVFISLCETLLNHDPERGVMLWRAVRRASTVRYVGQGGVEELLHVAFRANDGPAANLLRDSLLKTDEASTDQALDELAFAATHNGRQTWLLAKIAEDEASSFAWRQRRAHVLRGSLSDNILPMEGVWRSGERHTLNADLARDTAGRRHSEAAARHWWSQYLAASTPEDAYAAWVLFLRTCDRRVWHWVARDVAALNQRDALFDLKMAHIDLNKSLIDRQSKEHQKDQEREFLGIRTVEGLGPWASAPR
jgi:uncharacterized protein (DUF433 family)